MELKRFMELESLKSVIAQIMVNQLGIESDDAIVEAVGVRMLDFLDGIDEMMRGHEELGTPEGQVAGEIFDKLVYMIMAQDVMIQIQGDALGITNPDDDVED
jgi:hypothetical protein